MRRDHAAAAGGDRAQFDCSPSWTPYRGIPSRMKNVEVHIFPGVLHGYMMRGSPKEFHPVTRDFQWRYRGGGKQTGGR
jgi:hypothetical protein